MRFKASDRDGDGALSEDELAQCMQLARVETSPCKRLRSTSACDPPIAWKLERHVIGGCDYIVDPATQVGLAAVLRRRPGWAC